MSAPVRTHARGASSDPGGCSVPWLSHSLVKSLAITVYICCSHLGKLIPLASLSSLLLCLVRVSDPLGDLLLHLVQSHLGLHILLGLKGGGLGLKNCKPGLER